MQEVGARVTGLWQRLMSARGSIGDILKRRSVETLIIVVIVINAITLGLETSETVVASIGPFLHGLDVLIIAIFVIEIAARIYALGGRFFRDPWCLFDFFVIAITLVPATGNLSILRSLRILRALRLISSFNSVRKVVSGLLHAIPSMASILFLLLVLLYVFSVMATSLFGARFPDMFGTIGASAFTLFQVMTLEAWASDIARPVMATYPWAWLYFLPFIIITTFAVLNLFIGIVVEAMQSQHDMTRETVVEVTNAELEDLTSELSQLRSEIRALNAEALARAALRLQKPEGQTSDR